MHNHGYQYRALIVAEDGTEEYGEWFTTETLLRDAMRWTHRDPKKNYYCQRRKVRCGDACDAEETLEVIAAI